jgi:hypothetical protein
MAKSKSKAKTKKAVAKRQPPIRLACVGCDRDDYDGVWRLPKNWTAISKEQTLGQSKAEVTPDETTRSVFDWHTHIGYCPECQ